MTAHVRPSTHLLRWLLVAATLAPAAGCASKLKSPTATATVTSSSTPVGGYVRLDGSSSTDPNGLALSYAWRWISVPAGSQAKLQAADQATPWFSPDVPGSYTVELVVSDGELTSAPATAQVTIGDCGSNTPTVQTLKFTPTTANVGTPVQLTADAADADLSETCTVGDELSWHWSLAALPAGSHAALDGAELANPSFVPDVPGEYDVAVYVTDLVGHRSKTLTGKTTVGACGTAVPTASMLTATPAMPATGQVVSLAGSFADADNAAPCSLSLTLTPHWSFVSVPAGSSAKLNADTVQSPWFLADVPGVYVAAVTVDDGKHTSPATQLSITVGACGSNVPTLTSIGASPATPGVGATITLTNDAADADDGAPCNLAQRLGYHWAFDAIPAGSHAAFDAAGLGTPSFVADLPGDYVVSLFVDDGTGRTSATVTKKITVGTTPTCGANPPVVASIASSAADPTNVSIGDTIALTATASDPDDVAPCNLTQTLSYDWWLASVPAGSHAALNGGALTSPSFVPDVGGAYGVAVRVQDDTGLSSAVVTTTITANPAVPCGAHAPTIGAIAASPSGPNTGDTVVFSTAVSDADNVAPCSANQHLTLSWTLTGAPAGSHAQLNGASLDAPSLTVDVPGTYTVSASVSDGTGLTSSVVTRSVTAGTCGSNAPAIAALSGSPAQPGVGGPVSLLATVTDADLSSCGLSETLVYDWFLVSAPAGATGALNDTHAVSPSFTPDVAGVWTFGLQVSSTNGTRSAIATTQITVGTTAACGTATPVASIAGATQVACQGNVGGGGGGGGNNATCNVQFSGPAGQPPTYTIAARNNANNGFLNGEYVDIQLDASSSSDPDAGGTCNANQPLYYTWSVVSLPAGTTAGGNGNNSGGSFNSTSIVDPTFRVATFGTYKLRLIVSDGVHSSAPVYVTINYANN